MASRLYETAAHAGHQHLQADVQRLLGRVRLCPLHYIHNPGKSYPKVKSWFEQLRKAEGDTLPIGAAGFCWGGKHTVLLAAGERIDGKLLIDAGFTAHPSMLKCPRRH